MRLLAQGRRSVDMWRPMWRYLYSRVGDVVDERTSETMFA